MKLLDEHEAVRWGVMLDEVEKSLVVVGMLEEVVSGVFLLVEEDVETPFPAKTYSELEAYVSMLEVDTSDPAGRLLLGYCPGVGEYVGPTG